MNKILTEIYLPAGGKTYEVYLSADMLVSEAVTLLADMFTEISEGFFCTSNVNILCEREEGRAFDPNKTLSELGLHNHSALMFI